MNPLDIRFKDLDFPDDFLTARLKYCVRDANMETLGDIVKWAPYEWLRVPNFGLKSLKRLEEKLAEYGLMLRDRDGDTQFQQKIFVARWQPIATAPRDGTEFLASQNGAIDVVMWIDGRGFREAGGVQMHPDHWMRLPDPPEVYYDAP